MSDAPTYQVTPLGPTRPDPLGFRLGRLGRLARKEVTETLRDRRTLFTLVLMPLLLYPLLVLGFRQFFLSGHAEATIHFKIAFASEKDAELLRPILLGGEQLLHQREPDKPRPILTTFIAGDLDGAVRDGQVDLGFRLTGHPSLDPRGGQELAMDWELAYREESVFAREALQYVERLIAVTNTQLLSDRLARRGLKQRPDPVRLIPAPVPSKTVGGLSLAAFVPLVLILMTITGAVYPAIDLTAGERERGTLEILVAAPIPRVSVLLGKYVAVVTVSVLTAVVNLTAMAVSLWVSGLADKLLGPQGVSVLVYAEVFALLILFAAFFSAVLLTLTSFARSFKEAQAYLIPLMVVSLAPGLLGLVPGLTLSFPFTVVPLLNIVLLARDLLEGTAHWLSALVVVVSTSAYAFVALVVAARLFGAEAVLYAESSSWRSWFRRRAAVGERHVGERHVGERPA